MLLMTKGGFSDLMGVFSYCCLSLVEGKYSNFTLVFLPCLPHETPVTESSVMSGETFEGVPFGYPVPFSLAAYLLSTSVWP